MKTIKPNQKREFQGLSFRLFFLIFFLLLFSSLAYAQTSIEMTTVDWINIFGNVNMSNNNLVNIGNVSIVGNLSVEGNFSVNTSTLFVDATNDRVGIGTTNPAETCCDLELRFLTTRTKINFFINKLNIS